MGQKKSPNTNVVDSVSQNNVIISVTDVDNIVEIPSDEDDIYLKTLEDIKPNFILGIDWSNHDVDDDKIRKVDDTVLKKSDEVVKRTAIEHHSSCYTKLVQ